MALHRNVYSFVYRGEDTPETNNVIWIHHQKKNDLQSPIVAEIWIKNEWRPLIFGTYADGLAECCCCGSPFVRDEGENSAVMRSASNTARGKYAFVAGYKSHAFGDNSAAIGTGIVADLDKQIVIGQYNERSNDYKFAIGIGNDDANRKNAITIKENGDIIFYNVGDGNYYSLQEIIAAIGSGDIIINNDHDLMASITLSIVDDPDSIDETEMPDENNDLVLDMVVDIARDPNIDLDFMGNNIVSSFLVESVPDV